MTKRAIFDRLELARDVAWQAALRWDTLHNVQPWPEQRSGSLTRDDIESARLRGAVNGLDAARRALLGDWRPPCR